MHRSTFATVAAAALLGLAAIPTLAAPSPREDTLEKRAILPAEATAPAPWNGVPDTDPVPAPESRQPVGGFSALLDAPGRDVYWAMPDNGFGSKANSRSFILRVYRVRADWETGVRADWETGRGGRGDMEILDWIDLRDPDELIPFAIVREGSEDRLLTGGTSTRSRCGSPVTARSGSVTSSGPSSFTRTAPARCSRRRSPRAACAPPTTRASRPSARTWLGRTGSRAWRSRVTGAGCTPHWRAR